MQAAHETTVSSGPQKSLSPWNRSLAPKRWGATGLSDNVVNKLETYKGKKESFFAEAVGNHYITFWLKLTVTLLWNLQEMNNSWSVSYRRLYSQTGKIVSCILEQVNCYSLSRFIFRIRYKSLLQATIFLEKELYRPYALQKEDPQLSHCLEECGNQFLSWEVKDWK